MPAVLQPKPCVYAVYADGQLIYIGQTVDLRNRMSEHRIMYSHSGNIQSPWGLFDSVTLKVSWSRHYGDFAMRELRLIRRLRPLANRRGFGRQKYVA